MSIRWDSESDWKDNQDSSGTTGRNGELKQGYSRDKPPLSDGLVGYWPLHNDSATDYSGNGNHGTLKGDPTTGVAGRGGLEATSFDGSDDIVETAVNLSDYSSVSVSTWVYFKNIDSGNYNYIVAGRENPSENRLRLTSDSHIDFGNQDSIDNESFVAVSNTQLRSGRWYHIVGTYDSSDGYKVYINGSLDGSSSETGWKNASHPIGIGARNRPSGEGNDAHSNAVICDTRIYDRALSSTEIQTLYKWGSSDQASPPTDGVARYPLDGDSMDSWGSNDGTNNGATFVSDAIRAQGAEFQRSNDDYVNIGTPSVSGSMTLMTWFNANSVSYSRQSMVSSYVSGESSFILGLGAGANSDEFSFFVDDGNTDDRAIAGTASTNEWYHIAGVFDVSDSVVQLYVNGTLRDEVDLTISQPDWTVRDWALGADASNNVKNILDGRLDETRIYDYALSPSEVFELYRWGTKGRDMRKQLVTQ